MAKYKQKILSFDGIVGTEEEIAAKLGISVRNLYNRIYRKHTSLKEVTVNVVKLRDTVKPYVSPGVVYDLICDECGSSFQSTRRRKICSSACRVARQNRASLEQARKRPKPIKDMSPRPCPCCGAEFIPGENGATGKYCSVKCQNYSQWKKTSDRIGNKVRHGLAMKISRLLRSGGRGGNSGYFKYVGMYGKGLYDRLVSLMTGDMKIDNYGLFGWHIDHVIPRSLFDMTREDHVRLCFNWKNLRPLWRDDNVGRRNRITQDDIDFVGPEYIAKLESIGLSLSVQPSPIQREVVP